nr:hypothetical protein [Thermogemmatispora sp.]
MTTEVRRQAAPAEPGQLIEMAWDPITRIVGSLGIYTKIDFKKRQVVECYSTSSIFRGYSIFLRGKDPREYGLWREAAGSRRVDSQPRRGGGVHV